jgi:hypothetical protein
MSDVVKKCIVKLNRGVAAGCDGVSAEHLRYGLSEALCNALANVYSIMLSHCVIPDVLQTGIIIPILKKASLDANVPASYRPVTISSVHSKLVEMLLLPEAEIYDTQYGFRDRRGTAFVTSLVNDLVSYFSERGSPVYLSSLDAEKCFDSIWHDGLLYKLWGVMPPSCWYFLFKWYKNTYAAVSWKGAFSSSFKVTEGMKQGSILSPTLFNIFINDLLISLDKVSAGVNVFGHKFNSCAYADDITVFSSTVSGLQNLVDVCVLYASQWRFNFGVRKTQFTTLGKNILKSAPHLFINGSLIEHKDNIEMLGVSMDSNCDYTSHVNNRISACRRGVYALAPAGMTYPGLCTKAKVYLWKSVGAPLLFYSMECIPLAKKHIASMYSAQGKVIKSVLGLSKRSHHGSLLDALGISSAENYNKKTTVSFYSRIFNVETPLLRLQCLSLAYFMLSGKRVKNTLLDKIVNFNISPIEAAFSNVSMSQGNHRHNNGVIDSLSYLLHHENFVKPWSSEFMLCKLLTKAF